MLPRSLEFYCTLSQFLSLSYINLVCTLSPYFRVTSCNIILPFNLHYGWFLVEHITLGLWIIQLRVLHFMWVWLHVSAVGRDISVDIVTGHGLDGPGFESLIC